MAMEEGQMRGSDWMCGLWTVRGRRPKPDLSCRYGNYPANYPGRIPVVLQTLSGQLLRP